MANGCLINLAMWHGERYVDQKRRHVWTISTKQDNLQIKWVNAIYFKDESDHSTIIRARNVWERSNMPKHRFYNWLAIQSRFPTVDRLKRMGAKLDNKCVLCLTEEESIGNFFFECEYSRMVLYELKNGCIYHWFLQIS
ncbi:Beta-1 3-galactosyl-O-glycosyl-glycoprotein beta-1 6-N-acetylglucosaminyltransferase 3 [Bienertia sinuspersici]